MKQLDSVLTELNHMRHKGSLWSSDYQESLNKVLRMQDAENEHEKQLAEIEAQRPLIITPPPEPQKTIITYTEADGLRIEHPHRADFTIGQRIALAVCRSAGIIILAAVVFVKVSSL